MSAAPSDAAAPAPGEKQAARLPGLRGHHKLYLAAVALVAVCVWLIVWLVVFGKVLPDDIGLRRNRLPSHCKDGRFCAALRALRSVTFVDLF